jgi:hypothetical protein
MGGTNEKILTPPPAATPKIGSTPITRLRIHENKGEVHLHDDANGKKFACPVAYFYQNWKQAKESGFSTPLVITGHDGAGNYLTAFFEKVIVGGKVDVSVSLEPLSFGDTFEKIDAFVSGK